VLIRICHGSLRDTGLMRRALPAEKGN
jgi:hypothetical protein